MTSLFALFLFAIAMSASPGPNNLMVATSVANFGLGRTIPHMLGIMFGFPVMLLLVGSSLGVAIAATPVFQHTLQYVGAAYMLFLAYKIGTTAGSGDQGAVARGTPLTFLQAAAFQWINPKAWIIAAGAVTTYGTTELNLPSATLLIAAVFAAVSFPSNALWALIGSSAARLLHSGRALRNFNRSMAVLLAGSILLLFV